MKGSKRGKEKQLIKLEKDIRKEKREKLEDKGGENEKKEKKGGRTTGEMMGRVKKEREKGRRWKEGEEEGREQLADSFYDSLGSFNLCSVQFKQHFKARA